MHKQHSDWVKAAQTIQIDTRPLIGEGRVDTEGLDRFASVNPATGNIIEQYPEAGEALVRDTVALARQTFAAGVWSNRPVAERSALIEAWAEKIRQEAETLALLDCLEMGMPVAQALEDVLYSADMMVETARLALSLTTRAGVTSGGTLNLNLLAPIGVVAAITPWNFPVNQALARIIAPLVMGNCVVLKPSEVSPGSALRLGDLALEAGLPPGVLSIVTGTGALTGARLVSEAGIDRIAFTGSTATGARIQALAASGGTPKPMTMELGGKSPQIVGETFEDLDRLAPLLARSVFWNAGQVCSAGTRLIVHSSRADALLEHLVRAAQAFRPGDPLDPATTLGPIATRAQYSAVSGRLDRARAAGLRPVLDGTGLPGLVMGPTIFDGVAGDAEIAREELFGPVLAVSRFDTAEEAERLANGSGFGLIATVWTRNLEEGHRLARTIRAGAISINSAVGAGGEVSPALGLEPAGRSGFGPDYGHAGLMQYAQLKLVSFNTA